MEDIPIPESSENNQIDNKEQNITVESTHVKKSDEKIDLSININKWGFAFMFLFAGLLAYILISGFIGIFPFERPDPLGNEVIVKSDLMLTIMLVVDLILLGLGIYFGWMRTPVEDVDPKQAEPEEGKEEEVMQEIVFSDVEKDNESTEEDKEE
ncbi:MAG: hypothetical protein ACTSQK_12750 [Candidatus Heimdallarchaeota archaeon]